MPTTMLHRKRTLRSRAERLLAAAFGKAESDGLIDRRIFLFLHARFPVAGSDGATETGFQIRVLRSNVVDGLH